MYAFCFITYTICKYIFNIVNNNIFIVKKRIMKIITIRINIKRGKWEIIFQIKKAENWKFFSRIYTKSFYMLDFCLWFFV